MKRLIRHILIPTAAVMLTVGLPFSGTQRFKALVGGETDAVTGASEKLDAPSGEYVIIINTDKHKNTEYLDIWTEYFETGESEDIYSVFEDISCVCAESDTAGLEMAKSFQSGLAENQMNIRTEDGVLMLSKAENGRFDLVVMSKEFYDKNSGDRIEKSTNARVIVFSDTPA